MCNMYASCASMHGCLWVAGYALGTTTLTRLVGAPGCSYTRKWLVPHHSWRPKLLQVQLSDANMEEVVLSDANLEEVGCIEPKQLGRVEKRCVVLVPHISSIWRECPC